MARSSCAWRIVLACMLVATGSAWGSDPVHKCRSADGQTHYQSFPCAPTQRTEWVRAYPTDPPVPAATATPTKPSGSVQDTRSSRSRSRSGARRSRTTPAGAVISMHRDAAGCERAKQLRDQAHARLGLKRDFATSRKLDDRVNAACR